MNEEAEKILKYFKQESIKNNELKKYSEEEIIIIKLHFKHLTNFNAAILKSLTEEDLINILKLKAKELGRSPHNTEMIFPKAIIFIDKFGSWENALSNAGLELLKEKPLSNNEIDALNVIKEKYIELNRVPFCYDVDELTLGRVLRFFGSWNNALIKAGFTPNVVHPKRSIKQEKKSI